MLYSIVNVLNVLVSFGIVKVVKYVKVGIRDPTVDEASLTADGNLLTVDGIEIFAKKMFPVSTVDASPSTVDALHRPSLTVFELGFLPSVRLTFLRSETRFTLIYHHFNKFYFVGFQK